MIEKAIEKIRKDFPTLLASDTGKNTVYYLDNAATTLKPQIVLDKIMEYYIEYPANIHRGIYSFSQKASDEYELARNKIARFINAEDSRSIVFTSGATASSNLFSNSFSSFLKAEDEIILSISEHHSNMVNWLALSEKIGFKIKYIPVHPTELTLDLNQFKELLSPRVKLVSVSHISNILGTENSIKDISILCKENNIPLCIDLAQSIAHKPINIQNLDADFAFFSGHKMFGPTGIGVFYMKPKWFEKLPPFFYGGGMISSVTPPSFTLRDLPEKFEGGTPPIAQAIGLGAAVDYIESIGFETISNIENYLYKEMDKLFNEFSYLKILKPSDHHIPIFSFNIQDVHPHDVASFLSENNIAVRTGQHCTEPLLNHLRIGSTVRISLTFYNNLQDIHVLREVFKSIWSVFHGN